MCVKAPSHLFGMSRNQAELAGSKSFPKFLPHSGGNFNLTFNLTTLYECRSKTWNTLQTCLKWFLLILDEWTVEYSSNVEVELARMQSELKLVVHSWTFEVHSKISICILSAFQIFWPILVGGPECFNHVENFPGAFEVDKIYWYLKGIPNAFCLHSKYSYGIPRAFEKFLGHSNSIWNILIAILGEQK